MCALLLALCACARATTDTESALTPTSSLPGTPALVVEYVTPATATEATAATADTSGTANTPNTEDASSGASAMTNQLPAESQVFIKHPVEPGDTLWGLAVQYGVPMAAIQLRNKLGASTVVKAGQVLEIPPPDAWEAASTYWVVYEVAGGDTLSGIAARYGLTTAALLAANELASADFLSIGQSLVLPLRAPAQVLVEAPTPTATAIVLQLPTPTPASASPDPTVAPTVVAVATVAPLPADIAAWPGEVWRIMNETRAAHGLPPYAYNDTLAQAAQLHAEDCSQRGSCSHTGSDGSDIKTRVQRVGYTGSYAECWAVRPSPQGVIDIWMDEVAPNDPHRRTVLHTWFTEVGIGVAPSPWKGYYYVIADFGRPR